jgi:hypothetical protein
MAPFRVEFGKLASSLNGVDQVNSQLAASDYAPRLVGVESKGEAAVGRNPRLVTRYRIDEVLGAPHQVEPERRYQESGPFWFSKQYAVAGWLELGLTKTPSSAALRGVEGFGSEFANHPRPLQSDPALRIGLKAWTWPSRVRPFHAALL